VFGGIIMRWIGFIAAIAPVLAGCSTFPRPEDVTRKSTLAIVHQIRCEAKRAVVNVAYNRDNPYPNPINYTTASISYDFMFDIFENNNASADGTWGLPYTLGGMFSLTASGQFDRNRHTIRNFKITDTFEELYNTQCDDAQPQLENLLYPISGEIVIYEVVSTFINLQQIGNPKAGEVFTFADTLQFTTTLSAGVKPKLVISPFTDRFRLAGANGNFSADRTDFHKVMITLAGEKPRLLAGKPGAKTSGTAFGATARATAAQMGLLQTNSALVSTTLLQTGSNPKDRSLLELDRQRIIELQNRAQNLLIGP
jgi:hypothetical protein